MNRDCLNPRPRRHRRRGETIFIALALLVLVLTIAAVVIDLGRLSMTKRQLTTAAQASALAAASELMDQRVLYPGAPGEDISQLHANIAARQIAAATQEAAKFRDENQHDPVKPSEALKIGWAGEFEKSGWLFEYGKTESSSSAGATLSAANHNYNAAEVTLSRTQRGGNPVPMWLASWINVGQFDVNVSARALIARGVVGFRPTAYKSVPLVPVVVKSRGRHGWESQSQQPATAFNDQFAVNEETGAITSGQDGIPEVVIRLSLEDNSQTPRPPNGWLAEIGKGSEDDASRLATQISVGISVAHLASLGGILRVDGSVRLGEQDGEQATGLLGKLGQLQGRKRIWLLGTQEDDGSLLIQNAAAGRVVGSEAESGSVLVLKVQPCQLATDTAVVSENAPANPWLGKMILAR